MDPTTSPSPSLSPTSSTTAVTTAAPTWVIIVLMALGGLVIAGLFTVTLYNLAAPRAAFKLLIGVKGRYKAPRTRTLTGTLTGAAKANVPDLREQLWTAINRVADSQAAGHLDAETSKQFSASLGELIATMNSAGRLGKRATRTQLAIGGFSLLTIALIAVLAMGGDGVRDLRSSLVGSLVALVAAIAGFYFAAAGSDSDADPSPDGGGGGGNTNGGNTNGGDTNGGDTNGGDTTGGDTNGGDTTGGDTTGGDTTSGTTTSGTTPAQPPATTPPGG